MKKCCFVKFLRVLNDVTGFEYFVEKNIVPGDSFSELPGSLNQFNKIEFIKFDDIDSTTNVFVTIDCVDITDKFKTEFKKFIDTLNCKAIFVDFATYDEQDISEEAFDIIESLVNKPCYFISKNLLQNRDNHLHFEVLFYHHVREDKEIPRNILAYNKLKQGHQFFYPKYKGFYYPGHIRFHKVKFLEFLYQNKYLEDLIWSCTGPDFDKNIFYDFVPKESEEEFNAFEVLKLLPRKIDFNLFSKDVYNSRGGQVNLITYLDTTFEIVPETRFYDTNGNHGSKKTEKTWNNISEKTMKPTLLSHPFIMIAKPNTIKILEEKGLNYRFDFWNFDYDSIENHEERMNSIKNFTSKVMSMTIEELKDFNNEYYHFAKNNYNTLINDVYIKSVNDIWNKL
jgi:hypothetical protein